MPINIRSLLLIVISVMYAVYTNLSISQPYPNDSISIDDIPKELIDSIEIKEKNDIDRLIKEKIPDFEILTRPRVLKLPRKDVKVFIIDSLTGYTESHGYLVEKTLKRYSSRDIETKIYHVGIKDEIDRERRLVALVDILKFSEENQDIGIVINISFGSLVPRKAEHELFRQLKYRGVVVVASAGNENSPNKLYPAGYEDEVIAVSAVTNKHKESYSNYGKHIDISAPGGGKVNIQKETNISGMLVNEYTTYSIKAGTSFAAPRVAGTMALIMKKRPELHPDDIFQIIKNTSSPLNDEYYIKGKLGAGRLDWHITALKLYPLYNNLLLIAIIGGAIPIFSLITLAFIPVIKKGCLIISLPIILLVVYLGLFYFDLKPILGFMLSLEITVVILFIASSIIILQPIIGFVGLQAIKYGSLYINMGKYEKALANFNKALDIYPDSYKAKHGRIISLCLLGRYNEVIKSYNDGIEIGSMLEIKNFTKQALDCYNISININPDKVDAWKYKGNLLIRLKRFAEAKECFDQIERIQLSNLTNDDTN